MGHLKRTARWPDPQGQLRFMGTILRTGFHVARGNQGEGPEFGVFVPTGPGCWSVGPCPHVHSAPSPEQLTGGTLSTSHTVGARPSSWEACPGVFPAATLARPHSLHTRGPQPTGGLRPAGEPWGQQQDREAGAQGFPLQQLGGSQARERFLPLIQQVWACWASEPARGPPFPGPAGGLADR